MESDGEDPENIFEEYENTENNRESENIGDTSETPGIKIPVPKRVIKNPRLKFNAERLCGERGIPVLVEHFKNVKFKGVGHEKEDLDKLLTKLEHWTHRLFPSMKFGDCLHHIEKLGKKRPVQTCLRKMRLNMPISSNDFVTEDEDNVHRVEDSEPVEEVDAFDRLIGESQDILNSNMPVVEDISESNSMSFSSMLNSDTIGQVLGSASGSSLTEEQRERMERNKMLAAERRKARLAAQQNSSEIQPVNEEIIPPQNISNIQEKSFENSSRYQENISNISCDLFTKISDDEFSVEEGSSKLDNQHSKNLGLDDLMDVIDDEEPVCHKNTTAFSNGDYQSVCSNRDIDDFSCDIVQINSPCVEQNIAASISDNTNREMIIASEAENEENLDIESLLDLVNEGSTDI